MGQRFGPLLPVAGFEPIEMAFRHPQELSPFLDSGPPSLDLVEHMQPFLFLECECHLLSLHEVTFSLNCSTLTDSLNYNRENTMS